MYLPKIINDNSKSSFISSAYVNNSSLGKWSAVSYCQQENIPVFSPCGITYLPSTNSQVLLLNIAGTEVCIGSSCDYSKLNSGELSLYSNGGASILLKNNGDVVINGLIITSNGTIINPTKL